MADSILIQAMAPDVINQSWRRLRNEHTPWSLTVTRDQLQQHLLKHILECREQVLQGKYRPSALRQFPMLKPDGKKRVLSAQFLRDKLVQRSLLTVLEPKAEAIFHEDSFGYRPRRGVDLAIKKVYERIRVGQHWLVDADIKKFFDTIPYKQLMKVLKAFINDSSTMKLVEMWLKQGAHCSSLLGQRRGISQGAILSPIFCNIYLNQFDTRLSNANIPFVRFADDFLLFATNKSDAEKAKGYAQKQLEALGLELHPDKTRIVKSSPAVKFLGRPLLKV